MRQAADENITSGSAGGIRGFLAILLATLVSLTAFSGAAAATVNPQVAVGSYHTVTLKSDGTIWTWGDNEHGQLGDGSSVNQVTPRQVSGLTDMTAVAAGDSHTVALKNDGTVWVWGYNGFGQLGDGTVIDRSTPLRVPGLGGIVAVAAGGYVSLALKNDGSVWAWGRNDFGQLGDGTTTQRSTPQQVTGLSGITAIATGGYHSVALKNDGSLWSWGWNEFGQLGDGTTTQQTTSRQIAGLNGVAAIAAGNLHTVVVKTDGTVWAWGNNQYNQLGDDTTTQRLTPQKVSGLTGVGAIAAGGYHTVALQNGVVWTWGDNEFGQLGEGTTSRHGTPVQVSDLTGIGSIATGSYHTVAVKNDGVIFAWGDNEFGQLGTGSTTSHPTPYLVAGIIDAISIAAGSFHSVAVKSDGTVWAWGDNQYGQLGNGATIDHATPQQVTGLTGITAVSAGDSHTVALKNDGTVWTWGGNDFAQLGDGTTNQRSIPQQVPGLVNITAIAAGEQHSVALDNNGKVWAWGSNVYGQLGDGSTMQQPTPVKLTGLTGITAIAAGKYHTVVLRNDASVLAWGYNISGQLGDGTIIQRTSPVAVAGIGNVSSIEAGGYHTTVVKTDGTVWTWGYNIYGQLGDNSVTDHSIPAQVSLDNTTTVGAGTWHTVALMNNSTVWTWGLNEDGQLGDGSTITAYHPVEVAGISGITTISAGGFHTVALKSDGSVLAWGSNSYGQVGDGRNLSPSITTGLNLGTFPPVTVATPAGGTYYYAPEVTLVANKQSTIYYTIDGSLPTTASLVYNGPISISGSSVLQFFSVDLSGSFEPVKTETYTIEPGFPLNVIATGSGTGTVNYSIGGTCSGSCIRYFGTGSIITLTALPELSSQFTDWSGCDQVTGNQCTVTMNAMKNVTVTFSYIWETAPQIAAGEYHTLALKNDGTVWAWGRNSSGQLGDGTTTDHLIPAQVTGLSRITAIAAGQDFNLALKNDGTLWAWGSNIVGQLGDSSTTTRYTPIKVAGLSELTAIAAGASFALALKSDGTLWSWGGNYNGQLGDGTTTNRNFPAQVMGINSVVAISCGLSHSLAVKSDGTAWGWGSNSYGQLGGTDTPRKNPVNIDGLSNVKAITSLSYASAALKNDGTVWAWGNNSNSQLGTGAGGRLTPSQVIGLNSITDIDGGEENIIALRNDGTVWVWGINYSGILGDGSTSLTVRTSPYQLPNFAGITAMNGGRRHSVAVKNDGTAWAWGANNYGKLGDGTYTTRYSPTKVVNFNMGSAAIVTTSSVAGGIYDAPLIVSLTTNKPATIYYTIDGSDPTNSPSKVTYSAAIPILTTSTLKFYAVDSEGINEPVKTAVYTIIDTTPPVTTASPSGGTYATPQSVTLTANEPATIYYTTNGSDPVTSLTRGIYSGALTVAVSTVIKYYAQDIAGHIETVKTTAYTINPPVTSISPPSATYAMPKSVTLTANQPATIYYTTNGLEPTTTSAVYSGPFTVAKPTIVKYFAKVSGGGSEAVKTAVYVINPPVTTVTPPGGTYSTAQSVTLTANQPATIYYTSNGLEPTTASPVYSGPLTIATPKTLKYFAKVAGGMSEAVKTAVYIIKQNQTIIFNPLMQKRFKDPVFTLDATASSGLAITYTSSNPAVATVSGNIVTIIGAGTTTITAKQGGDGNYNPAPDVVQTFSVAKAAATVTLDNLNTTYDGTAKTASASTTPPGLTVSTTYAGSTTAPSNAGIYAMTATITDANYEGSATATLTIAKANQTITFTALPARVYGDPTFALNATASSGLSLSYTSSDTSVATVSGSTVTIIGAGTTTISAIQNGNNNYNAATTVSKIQTVNFLQLNVSGTLNYFTSLSSAYNAIINGTDAAIHLVSGTLTEVVTFDKDYIVTLGGGYSTAFTANAGVTTLRGNMIIQKGTVIIDGSIMIM